MARRVWTYQKFLVQMATTIPKLIYYWDLQVLLCDEGETDKKHAATSNVHERFRSLKPG